MTHPNPVYRPHYDVIIVGARCAGAATAMLLARAGLRVLAVDKSPYGADTLSTHSLMRPAVMQLKRWGLLGALTNAGTPAIRRSVFHYTDANGVERIDVPIEARFGVDVLYAPRRTVLDPALVDAARQAGAEVQHRVTVTGLLETAGRVVGVSLRDRSGTTTEVRADLVIGADGVRSRVAEWVRSAPYLTSKHSTASVYGYFDGMAVDGYQWHFGDGVGAGAIPTNDGLTCVFASVSSARFSELVGDDIRAGFESTLGVVAPELAEAVRQSPKTRMRGCPGRPGFFRAPVGRGWALVGDAGYFRDPLTAHGITDALRDAELLARAILHGSEEAMTDYHTTRDLLSAEFFEATDEIASGRWTNARLKELHRALSREMSREAKALNALDVKEMIAA